MNKKDYIVKVLTSIQQERPPAVGLIALVQKNKLDEYTIDAIQKMLISAVDSVYEKYASDKIQKATNIINKIKELEYNETEDLIELDKKIQSL